MLLPRSPIPKSKQHDYDDTSRRYPATNRHASCRFCGAGLRQTFVDLGMSPLCETYPSAADLNRGEIYYPLHVYVCVQCFLVQLEEYESAENIFSDYPYFSSYSDSWLKHCENYCDKMIDAVRPEREELCS